MLRKEGVRVDGINRSLEKNNKTGDFRKKPYFSIIIDDKAGFNHYDWPEVYQLFQDARKKFKIYKEKKQ